MTRALASPTACLRIQPPGPGVWNLFPELEITGENGGVETIVLPISVRLRGQ